MHGTMKTKFENQIYTTRLCVTTLPCTFTLPVNLDSHSVKWQVIMLLLKPIKLCRVSCLSYPLASLRCHTNIADFFWSRLQAYGRHTLVARNSVKWTCAVTSSLDRESGSVRSQHFYFPTYIAVYQIFILVSQGTAYQNEHTVFSGSNTPAKQTNHTAVPVIRTLSTRLLHNLFLT